MSELAASQYASFAYLTAPKASSYRGIMLAFVEAKDQFAVHLRPDDIAQRLSVLSVIESDELADMLDQLASPGWGNLLAFPDTSRVSTLEDFQRRRMLYQLSPAGEAAERALGVYDRSFGERGELQSVALENIAAQLVALAMAIHEDQLDLPLIHNGLRSLTAVFSDLADNASAFMGSLQRSIDLQDADLDAFVAYKDRLIGYIERFISDLAVRGQRIAQELGVFTPTDIDRLCELVARRELEDRLMENATDFEAMLRQGVDNWRRRWQGLVDWFVSSPQRKSEADLLRARARSAVPQLLQLVAVLGERQSGRADRSTDFLALAGWFAALPDDDSRHRLWRAAFGLTPSRHLSVPPDMTGTWLAQGVKPGSSWNNAVPIAISAQLRATGRWERRGPGARIQDRSEAKRVLAEQAQENARLAAAARQSLAGLTPTKLSAIGPLDEDQFRLILSLLGDAVGALGDADEASLVSSEGSLQMHIKRPPDAARTAVSSPAGTLTGPDFTITLTETGSQ